MKSGKGKAGKSGKRGPYVLELVGSLTVAGSGALAEKVRGALTGTKELELVLDKVSEVDLSFIQILAACVKTARSQGKRVRVKHPVPVQVMENITAAGLPNHGSCPGEECPWCLIQNPGSWSLENG